MNDSWTWSHIKAVAQVSQSSGLALGSCAGPRRIFLAQQCRYSGLSNTGCSWVCSCITISALCAPKGSRAIFYEQAKLSQRTQTLATVADLHQRLLLTQLRQSRIILLFSPINPPGWKISVVESRIKAITTVCLFCGAPI